MVKRTEYPRLQITAQLSEDTTNSVWTAFDQDTDGQVILERQSAFCPNQTFFSLDLAKDINLNARTVTKIAEMDVNISNLFVALHDSTLIGEIISLTNPISSRTDVTKPVSVTENPVDVAVSTNRIFFLTPGNASGTDAELHIYTLSGTFDETLTLTGVNNASSVTYDSDNDNIWVLEKADPGRYIRVYPDGGSSYNFTIFTL